MKEKSYAKINLTLDITGLLPNGYHSLCMVMHSVNLYDTISVIQTNSNQIQLKTNVSTIPCDHRNHAYKAALLFFDYTGIQHTGILIDIQKQIPVSAGLAGGSSNAATVLKLLNQLFKADLSTQELCNIGKKVGADVPYCIHGGTMLAEGIGEILTPLPLLPQIPILLAKPDFGISTPESFQEWDKLKTPIHPNTEEMIKAIKQKDVPAIGRHLCNTLEAATFQIVERSGNNPILQLKECMADCGALGTLMSGSGPTVFGLFSSMEEAQNAEKKLKAICQDVFLTTT